MRAELARHCEFGKGALVMERVISFLAVAGMFSPLQLAEEPLYGKPPVAIEGGWK